MGTETDGLRGNRIYASLDKTASQKPLPALCLDLLAEQKRTWPACGRGYESLKEVREREIPCNGFSVRVQHNPGRITSTLADVGEKAVRGRACFLCPDGLPEGQKGILYRDDYLILCNPMPVFPAHFTISHLRHLPQGVDGAVTTLLRLMADLGPSFRVLYNGPRCGASAPDHLHFQAVPAGLMPIEGEISAEKRDFARKINGVFVWRVKDVARQVVILDGPDPDALGDVFQGFVKALKGVLLVSEEPMMNLICLRAGDCYAILVFPRAKHRPDAFYGKGGERLAVSPAVVEMGGVIVSPMERDFERLDRARIEGIFHEVSPDAGTVEEAIRAMG
ncbi:MAG: DUF4922 domain-containing protein [Syntrophorhabdales bacterium]|jgi:hypothetical protein